MKDDIYEEVCKGGLMNHSISSLNNSIAKNQKIL